MWSSKSALRWRTFTATPFTATLFRGGESSVFGCWRDRIWTIIFLWDQNATLSTTGRRFGTRSVLHCHAVSLWRVQRFRVVEKSTNASNPKGSRRASPVREALQYTEYVYPFMSYSTHYRDHLNVCKAPTSTIESKPKCPANCGDMTKKPFDSSGWGGIDDPPVDHLMFLIHQFRKFQRIPKVRPPVCFRISSRLKDLKGLTMDALKQ